MRRSAAERAARLRVHVWSSHSDSEPDAGSGVPSHSPAISVSSDVSESQSARSPAAQPPAPAAAPVAGGGALLPQAAHDPAPPSPLCGYDTAHNSDSDEYDDESEFVVSPDPSGTEQLMIRPPPNVPTSGALTLFSWDSPPLVESRGRLTELISDQQLPGELWVETNLEGQRGRRAVNSRQLLEFKCHCQRLGHLHAYTRRRFTGVFLAPHVRVYDCLWCHEAFAVERHPTRLYLVPGSRIRIQLE